MTQTIKKFLTLFIASMSVLALFNSVSVQAQYGGTTIITNPSSSSSTSSSSTSTSSGTILTPTNKCAGSNASSSVVGDTLNINLCNIKSGNTIVINNLNTNSLESIELTFNSNVDDGVFQLVKIPESLAFPNLNGSFIAGYELLTTRFDRTNLSNIKITYRVDKNTFNRFSSINAYTSNSPWAGTNLTKVSEDSSFVRYSSSTGYFKQYAISGTNPVANTAVSPTIPASSQVDLIRTGGFDQVSSVIVLFATAIVLFAFNNKRNLLKI
jgi:hypothetical protein